MSSDVTYSPLPSCGICLNLGTYQVRADARVKGYLVCWLHAGVMEQAPSFLDALRLARGRNAIQGGAA